jgi:hypothetical protein
VPPKVTELGEIATFASDFPSGRRTRVTPAPARRIPLTNETVVHVWRPDA